MNAKFSFSFMSLHCFVPQTHTHTHAVHTRIIFFSGMRNTLLHHSSSGQSSSPPPISVIIAMPAMYTHQDSTTMRKTENIPRLRLPRTTVIVLSKLVRGGRGGGCCMSSSSMLVKRWCSWCSRERERESDKGAGVSESIKVCFHASEQLCSTAPLWVPR